VVVVQRWIDGPETERSLKLTVDLAISPDLQLDVTARREASNSSITPRNSHYHQPLLATILPQNTGEWIPAFPSFRQSLLGGKSLNRFSSFVTSGAEAFLLNGGSAGTQAEDKGKVVDHRREDTSASNFEAREAEHTRLSMLGLGEADRHTIDAGPAGPTWRPRNPAFKVLVHSPSKRTNGVSGAYTMYSITSIFAPAPNPVADWVEVPDPDDVHPPSPTETSGGTRITVERRFSQFVMLHTVLSRRLPGIILPPLPEKQYAGRFSDDFVEARRGDLERYLNKIVRHPIVRYAEVVTFFLGCENESVCPSL
jgi:sorting nexin-9/18/33